MSGALWALAAGAGFGVFQAVNRQAVRDMDVYVATFIQLVISAIVLMLISFATQDVSLLFHAPKLTLFYFAAAGFFHFFIGWTFLNASQKKIGAARTSPLTGTNPLFGVVIAAITLGEFPTWLELIGVAIIVLGAYLISKESTNSMNVNSSSQTWTAILNASWLGLGAAFFWAVSPIFIKLGLQGLSSPLLGVTVGMITSAIAYGIIILWQRDRWQGQSVTNQAWTYKILAGVLVGFSTWMRWIALDLAPVAIVLALMMISTPLVILLSPIISGKHLERVTRVLWVGTGLILGGALLLTLI